MFERPHHQRIAHVLAALDGELLRQHGCLFGGGTCITLRHGEYRESVDIDFLVSDAAGYRELRQLVTGPTGLNAVVRAGAQPLTMLRDVRADQYGLRTVVQMDGQAIKFEIVREARIALEAPGPEDVVCGIGTLTRLDLAMMDLRLPLLRAALTKATQAYGAAVARRPDQGDGPPARATGLAGAVHADHGHDDATGRALAKSPCPAQGVEGRLRHCGSNRATDDS